MLVGRALSCLGTAILSGGLSHFNGGDVLVLWPAFLRAYMVIPTKRLMAGRALSSAALTAVQAGVVLALTASVLTVEGGAAASIPADLRFWLGQRIVVHGSEAHAGAVWTAPFGHRRTSAWPIR